MKISVLVPVYKKPKFFADIARKVLSSSFEDKEIIAVIDGEMTPEIKEAIEPFGNKIRVIYPNEHLGKAGALNKAVEFLSTDALLFLDNDVLLPDDPLFLTNVANEVQTYDIVEIPKEVIVESFISAMISYEYLVFAMAGFSLAKISKRSPALIGSAFAVKKELFDKLSGFRRVVHEDGDFGARAFRLHARYSYNPKLKVKTTMPNTLSDWCKQRKRWALINVLWLRDHFLNVLSGVFKYPSLILSFTILIFPFVSFFLFYIIMQRLHLTPILPFVFMVSQIFHLPTGVFLLLSHFHLILQGVGSILQGLLFSSAICFGFSRVLKFRFNFFEYIFFYFIYSPIWFIATLVMWILLLLKKVPNLDWKV